MDDNILDCSPIELHQLHLMRKGCALQREREKAGDDGFHWHGPPHVSGQASLANPQCQLGKNFRLRLAQAKKVTRRYWSLLRRNEKDIQEVDNINGNAMRLLVWIPAQYPQIKLARFAYAVRPLDQITFGF